jgi:hypothetical protein
MAAKHKAIKLTSDLRAPPGGFRLRFQRMDPLKCSAIYTLSFDQLTVKRNVFPEISVLFRCCSPAKLPLFLTIMYNTLCLIHLKI